MWVGVWLLACGANAFAQSSPSGIIGVGSCAAAGCHGGDGTRKKLDGSVDFSTASYSTWMQRDPHARAYEVLLAPRSQKMIQQLGDGWQPAHQEQRCLVCHATLEPASGKVSLAQQESLQDGVSCEACHGAAEKWLGPHTEHTWRGWKSAADRAALGFVDLRLDLTQRAQTCAKCHVGGPGRDVNHDLIAAGHPRLNFELAAYHANLPAHWSVSEDRKSFPVADNPNGSALEAKLWLVGQLTSADAALQLLEARAAAADGPNRSTPWPEFSEYGCFACHHDLQAPSWRQQQTTSGRRPGSYPWGTWTYPMLIMVDRTEADSPLSKALGQLGQTMSSPAPVVAEVRSQAKVTRELIAAQIVRHSAPETLTAERIQQLFERVTREGQQLAGSDWDAAAQVYLGTVSLYQARSQSMGRSGLNIELSNMRPLTRTEKLMMVSLRALREKLKFPQPPETSVRFASPRTFDSQRIDVIRDQLRKIEELAKRP